MSRAIEWRALIASTMAVAGCSIGGPDCNTNEAPVLHIEPGSPVLVVGERFAPQAAELARDCESRAVSPERLRWSGGDTAIVRLGADSSEVMARAPGATTMQVHFSDGGLIYETEVNIIVTP